MQACVKCNVKIVNLLASHEWIPKIDINKQNQYGWTALHFAYSTKPHNPIARHKIIQILLCKGANSKLKNNEGSTPKDLDGLNLDIDAIESDIANQRSAKRRKTSNSTFSTFHTNQTAMSTLSEQSIYETKELLESELDFHSSQNMQYKKEQTNRVV